MQVASTQNECSSKQWHLRFTHHSSLQLETTENKNLCPRQQFIAREMNHLLLADIFHSHDTCLVNQAQIYDKTLLQYTN